MDKVKAIYSDFIENDNHVYLSKDDYVIVLKKLEDTVTNENDWRFVDKNHAWCTGDKLEIVKIFHKLNPEESLQLLDSYVVGEIIKTKYVKTIEQAFYTNFDPIKNKYTGIISSYSNDGALIIQNEYAGGECIKKITYYTNVESKIRNAKAKEEDYKTGYVIDYYPNGKKECEGAYVNGIRSGRFVYYNSDGSIDIIRDYDYRECHIQKIIDHERKIGGDNWMNNAIDKIRVFYKDYDVGKTYGRLTELHPELYKEIYTRPKSRFQSSRKAFDHSLICEGWKAWDSRGTEYTYGTLSDGSEAFVRVST